MNAIYSVLNDVQAFPHKTPEYVDKMLHKIPYAPVVDRARYILKKCKDRDVLNLGSASGQLHQAIKTVAKSVLGVDREPADIQCDLDREPERLLGINSIELIVAGEIFEHLANPGRLLEVLRTLKRPLLITVPNALSRVAYGHALRCYENVNADHVSWYSHTTLKTLVTRYGFRVSEFYWYEGKPVIAEGLIFLVK